METLAAKERIAEAEKNISLKLNLSELGLTSLPSEIGNLINLTELNLSKNKLTSLPNEIGNLINLQKLYLSGGIVGWGRYDNQLISLPPEIGKLINLKVLDLRDNKLTSLPPEIGKLINLKELDLSSNQFTSLPSFITQLTKLEELKTILKIPKEINEFLGLNRAKRRIAEAEATLDLSLLYLTSLPNIRHLINLTELDLKHNQLTSLPNIIDGLINLTKLDLSDNHLTSLPNEIGALINLKVLDLTKNKLASLPLSLKRMIKLDKLVIGDNPDLIIPTKIVETEDAKTIIEFYIKNLRTDILLPEKESTLLKMIIHINHYIYNLKLQPPKCFISYAWEVDEKKKLIQQEWLTKFKEYLELLRVVIFLDLFDMELNLKETMEKNINDSDFIIIICTPRYKQRVEEKGSNARFELDNLLNKNKKIIPIIYEGKFSESVPSDIRDSLAIDFTKIEDFIKNMVGYYNPKGIIPTIFGIKPDQIYEKMVDRFLSL